MRHKSRKKRVSRPLDQISDVELVDEIEAAAILHMSVYWLRKRRDEKKQDPPYLKIGGSVRYSVKTLR